MQTITVKKATYIQPFMVEIVFNNNKKTLIDFSVFLNNHSHPQFNKYKKPEFFKKFKIQNGNIVWGKNWDMIFPIWNLYQGKIE